MSNRRSFLRRVAGAGAGMLAGPRLFAAAAQASSLSAGPSSRNSDELDRPGLLAAPIETAVITPDVGDLPFTMDGPVKVFHLTAQVVKQAVSPDKVIDAWGFNGSAPGPTIQVTQGNRVRVVFENQLPEPTSMHWHGFEDRNQFDGMPGISQDAVRPGGRFIYEFDIHQEGTYFYHSHMAMQEMTGMLGGFIMHPKDPYRPRCDKDFLIHLQEYAVLPNNTIPNTMSMEFNWLVLNGKAAPATTPLIVKQGERVRIRFVNLGMDHHPMHLHGHTFQVTGTEGGRIQQTAWLPGNTVLVAVAQARDVEFVANNPGDWMLHCHLPHHMMNQMSSNVGKMTRTAGRSMATGGDMSAGMGMLQGAPGAPMGEDYGSSLGRGQGFGSASDMETANGPQSEAAMQRAMHGMQMGAPGDIAPNANEVPNFPQDAYMEGPGMSMDARVSRPENYGLRPGWSQYMQGMMTFVRVLPPSLYREVTLRMKQANRPNDPYASMLRVLLIALFATGLFACRAHGQSFETEAPVPATQSASPETPAAAPPVASTEALIGQDTHSGASEENLPPAELLKDIAGRPAIGLAEFLAHADGSNPTLAEAKDQVRRSEAQAHQAGLPPNPTAGYEGDQIRGGAYGGGEQGGFLEQTVVLGGKLGLRRNIYEQQTQSSKIAVDEQACRVHNDVSQAFYAALASQQIVQVRRRLLGVALDAVATVHQLANVGQADLPDTLQTEVEAEQARVDFVAAQRQFLESFHALAALAGEPDLPVSPLAGDLEALPNLDAEQRVRAIVASSPSVQRAEQDVTVAQAKLRDQKREAVPDLELRAGEQQNGERLGASPSAGAVGAQSFAMASIAIPLWNRNQGNVAAAKADVDLAQEDAVRTRLELRQRAESLAQLYLAARFTAEQYRTELLPRSQRAYQLYLAKYESMAQAYPQVLISQRTLFQLQVGYLEALREAWANAIALENYTLSGGLTVVPRDPSDASSESPNTPYVDQPGALSNTGMDGMR